MKTINKLLKPAIEYVNMVNSMTDEEKIAYIKNKYNLNHGKGSIKKRKRKK